MSCKKIVVPILVFYLVDYAPTPKIIYCPNFDRSENEAVGQDNDITNRSHTSFPTPRELDYKVTPTELGLLQTCNRPSVTLTSLGGQQMALTNLNFVKIRMVKSSSILCYDCNSAFDPRCGVEFDPFSLGIVNCSLRDPIEHLEQGLESTLCRTIKMEIYGKVRVVRTCGYIPDDRETESNATCRRVSGNGEVFVTYCACESDLCNTASSISTEMALFSILGLISLAV